MNLLLDTHVWIWSQESPDRIGDLARRELLRNDRSIYVSTISTLEIARLAAIGLIELKGPLDLWIRDSLEALQASTIEISHPIAIGAYQLPGEFHKDPADRLIVATAREHELKLMTADRRILVYPGVETLDAET
ncbi:MAG: type II toxin-antitoxin system VapC family toxin [Opitutaceae bacterium]